MTYPKSDHFDGRRFRNADPAVPAGRGAGDLLRWFVTRRAAHWPAQVAVGSEMPPEAVPDGEIAVTWVGHSTFLLTLPGLCVLTDPVWSAHAGPFGRLGPRRVTPPGIAFEALPRIDLVLLSHNHYDHCDLPTLARLAREHAPLAVTALGNGALLRGAGFTRVTELDWWEVAALAAGARVTAVPAQHFSARTPFDRNRALWCGFALAHGGGTLLFAGDSGYGAHYREMAERLPAPDVALLPIGAYEPRWFMAPMHMDPAEAVRVHRELGARRSVAMHHATFRLTDEPMNAPVAALRAACREQELPAEAFVALEPGETRRFVFGSMAQRD